MLRRAADENLPEYKHEALASESRNTLACAACWYELICGQGRLQAYQKLGRTKIVAEVVTCTRKEAYLQSLVENIARTKPGSMDSDMAT